MSVNPPLVFVNLFLRGLALATYLDVIDSHVTCWITVVLHGCHSLEDLSRALSIATLQRIILMRVTLRTHLTH
jgi:hypothetical protein